MPKASHNADAAHHNRNSNVPAVGGHTTTTMNTTIELPENSRIVQPSYLEKNTGKVETVYCCVSTNTFLIHLIIWYLFISS